jgi:hypothetical protein
MEVVHTTGDLKEARDRTQAAEAYRRESYVRKFNGNKDAADKFIKQKDARVKNG